MTAWRYSVLLLVAVSVVACAKPRFDQPAVITPTVDADVSALVGDTRPREVLTSLVSTETFDNPRSLNARNQMSFILDDRGLWQINTTSTRDGGGSGSSQQLSLCGLFTLVDDGGSSTPTAMSGGTVFRNAFIPFTYTKVIDTVTQWQAKNVSTNAKHICMPGPGETFTYHYEVEKVAKSYNTSLATHTTESVKDSTCHVDAEIRPASQFAPSLHGDALAVSCEHTEAKIGLIREDYVFLRDSALYLPLKTVFAVDRDRPRLRVTMQYEAATYRP